MAEPIVCTPLRVEQIALRGATTMPIVHTGQGISRSGRAVREHSLNGRPVVVAGVGGGLGPDVRPGELVVAGELHGPSGTLELPSAPLVTGALRRAGLRARTGPIHTQAGIAHGNRRRELAATGALAVDTESAYLAGTFSAEPRLVLRAVVDAEREPLLRPGTVARGWQALRNLRAAGAVLDQWRAALGERELVLASPRSFCAGVGRAIEIVERALQRHGAPVYVRRQIVHNAHVVQRLEGLGAIFVDEVEQVPPGSLLVLAAHGVSPQVRADALARELTTIDATCPLVAKVHTEVKRYAGMGDTVFLIGHAEHEEVVGTVGEAPSNVIVVADPAEAARVRPRDPGRVAYAMQTTLAVDEANEIADVLRGRFPALRAPARDDICYATTNRQRAVRAVANEADLVLVVGSANSSNSARLAEVAERSGARAQLVEDAGEVELGWLAGARTIGITAGASAPPHLVHELTGALAGLGPTTARTTHVVDEEVHFSLPREVS